MPPEQAPPANTNLSAGAEPAGPEVLPLPTQWPGAFKAYKYSKQAFMVNIRAVVCWLLIAGVVNIAISILSSSGSSRLLGLANYITAPLFSAIITKVLIASVRRQRVSPGEAFSQGLPYWFNVFLLNILVTFTEVISFLLLIIPFFFVWPRLSLATYFLVDKNLSPIEAYKASWNATKGYVGAIYGILGAEIAMGLLAITIIGIPFAIYFLAMYWAIHAVLYEVIISSPGADQVTASTPTATTIEA